MTEAGDYYGSLGALLPDIWWEPGSWDDEPVADGAGDDADGVVIQCAG